MIKNLKKILIFLVIFMSFSFNVFATSTLSLDDEDFANGSLTLGQSFYIKNYEIGVPLVSALVSNGLSNNAQYTFTGNLESNTGTLHDRLQITKKGEKMFDKGNKLDVSISGIINYFIVDGKTLYFNPDSVYNITLWFMDYKGNYQTVYCEDYNLTVSGGSVTYELNYDSIPCDTYTLLIDVNYNENTGYVGLQNYLDNTSLRGKFTRYGGFSNAYFNIKDEKVDEKVGLLQSIIQMVKNIWDGITELPNKIWNFIKSGFEWIVDGLTNLGNFIIDGLKSLFIPEEGYFQGLFDDLYDFFSEKLGILILPFDLLADLLNSFSNISEGSGVLTIPQLSLFGHTIVEPTQLDLKGAMSDFLGNYYNLYYAFVDVIFIFAFVNLAKKKFDSIVGGGQA